jgi:seryl-tRNA synthetase
MIDIRILREQPELVKAAAKNKNASISAQDIDHLIELDAKRRDLLVKVEDLRRERNAWSDTFKQTKPTAAQVEAGKELKLRLGKLEAEFSEVESQYLGLLKRVPNIPTDDVPIGKTEYDNVVTKQVGQPRHFDFEPKNHWQLGEERGWIDKERAAKVAGSRFAYLKGALVRLHMALINFGMDVLMDETVLARIAQDADLKVSTKAFVPVLPPAMIRTEIYEATGRLNGDEITYKLEGDDLWLNASAEHSLVPMHQGEILAEADMPVRYVGYSTSFRREAGTYGKDMEGIFRLHQFDKLEIESLSTPETSLDEHLFLVAIQEYLMSELGLPYQVIMKSTADIGGANARGVDIEAWLPGQNKYRETHTADYMTDYQARRLAMRLRRANGDVELLHTNDATALSQRPLVAILENYQQADGSVTVPKALVKYYGKELL